MSQADLAEWKGTVGARAIGTSAAAIRHHGFVTLRSRPVDPRDISIEESDPTYRVYFWADDGRYCREFDLDGVDVVEEAIAWADENMRGGERYILGVRWPEQFTPSGSSSPEVAFIRLKGDPPPGQSVGRRQGS